MNKYRKKPVIIEAIKYTGQNNNILSQWSNGIVFGSPVLEPTEDNLTGEYTQIRTLEGIMTAIVGDYIIKGVKGEFYPCKSDIFHMTYELVE